MRLIDADALKEAILQERKYIREEEYEIKRGFMLGGLRRALRCLEEAPTVEGARGEWIPCKERLPNEGHGITYLISAMDGKAMRVTFAKYQPMSKTFRLSGLAGHWRPIAWMPLPKAYKPDMRGEGE